MADGVHSSELVDACLLFLQALGNEYGSQAAMDAWTKIADVVDPGLKATVFTAMLSGSTSAIITVTDVDRREVVPLIKAIRTYDRRKLGLKEAKEMWDGLRDNGTPIKLQITAGKVAEARDLLNTLNCTFT